MGLSGGSRLANSIAQKPARMSRPSVISGPVGGGMRGGLGSGMKSINKPMMRTAMPMPQALQPVSARVGSVLKKAIRKI